MIAQFGDKTTIHITRSAPVGACGPAPLWLATFHRYAVAASTTNNASYIDLMAHLEQCFRVGDQYGLLAAQAYDDLSRTEWARKIDSDHPGFSVHNACMTQDEDTLKLALRSIGQNIQQPVAATSAASTRGDQAASTQQRQQPDLNRKHCNFCNRAGHAEGECWDKHTHLRPNPHAPKQPNKVLKVKNLKNKQKGHKGKGKGRKGGRNANAALVVEESTSKSIASEPESPQSVPSSPSSPRSPSHSPAPQSPVPRSPPASPLRSVST